MENISSTYIDIIIYLLIILKLLRLDIISKHLTRLLLLIILLVGISLMSLSTLALPLLIFTKSDEIIGIFVKIVLPIVLIVVCIFNKELIIGYFDELIDDIQNKKTNFSRELNNSDSITTLNKYYKLVRNDLEHQFYYNLTFFILLQFILIELYVYEYIPFLGPIYEFGYYSISKLHLFWLIPFTFILTYFYSKYYFEYISNKIYDKFISICIFLKHKNKKIIIDDWKNISLVDEDSIDDYFEISKDITFVNIKQKMFFLVDDEINTTYRNFKDIDSFAEKNRYVLFNIETYKDFVIQE